MAGLARNAVRQGKALLGDQYDGGKLCRGQIALRLLDQLRFIRPAALDLDADAFYHKVDAAAGHQQPLVLCFQPGLSQGLGDLLVQVILAQAKGRAKCPQRFQYLMQLVRHVAS